MLEAEQRGYAASVDQVLRFHGRGHGTKVTPVSGSVRDSLYLTGVMTSGPGGAATPRGPAKTYRGGHDMDQRKPSLLAQVAEEATITIEQTAELLGLGRTAAYEAARRGEFPTRRLGRRIVVPVPALLEWLGVAR